MKHVILLLISFYFPISLIAQSSPTALIDSFFNTLRNFERQEMINLFDEDADLITVNIKGESRSQKIEEYVAYLMTMKDHNIYEKIQNKFINHDRYIAHAWLDYIFIFDGSQVYFGSNSIQMIRRGEKWKISQIIDSRYPMREYKDQWKTSEEVSHIMDNWHLAASEAQFSEYFGKMSAGSIFIGTDPSERWSKKEFMDYAKPFFDKGTTWSFTVTDRQVKFLNSKEKNLVLVEELLETWMGICRSSAILVYVQGEWLIDYYHLSIAVPNDIVRDYVKLIKK